jgi:hypothetical protein
MDELKEVAACLALMLLLLMLLEVTEAEKDPKLRMPKSRLVQGPDRSRERWRCCHVTTEGSARVFNLISSKEMNPYEGTRLPT